MSYDLVRRLRAIGCFGGSPGCIEAADEIERLQALLLNTKEFKDLKKRMEVSMSEINWADWIGK